VTGSEKAEGIVGFLAAFIDEIFSEEQLRPF
jgi:hypothetical protein